MQDPEQKKRWPMDSGWLLKSPMLSKRKRVRYLSFKDYIQFEKMQKSQQLFKPYGFISPFEISSDWIVCQVGIDLNSRSVERWAEIQEVLA